MIEWRFEDRRSIMLGEVTSLAMLGLPRLNDEAGATNGLISDAA